MSVTGPYIFTSTSATSMRNKRKKLFRLCVVCRQGCGPIVVKWPAEKRYNVATHQIWVNIDFGSSIRRGFANAAPRTGFYDRRGASRFAVRRVLPTSSQPLFFNFRGFVIFS